MEERPARSGTVVALLPRRLFRVALDPPDRSSAGGRSSRGEMVIAHATDSVRRNFIRLVEGDRVLVKLSPYDVTKGRIVGRIGE